MINKIIEFSAKRKFLVFLLVGAAVLFGWHSMKNTKLDAIPDLSDTQVIVYSKWDRSPDIMEDQVTYPITSALLGAPKVKDIRGFSDFGYSYVYIIFDEGTDIYWARSRTLEYLNSVTPRLPKGVNVELAKDATGVGWVFRVRAGGYQRPVHAWSRCAASRTGICATRCKRCRAWPKWRRSAASSAQYQVNVDPNKLLGYKIPIDMVVDAVQKANNDVGGRLVELTGREYMVRGRGYIKSLDDIREHRRDGTTRRRARRCWCVTWRR